MNSKPTVGSFFSGIGGLDLGFEQAGFQNLWANEVDSHQASIFKENFTDTKLYEESIHLLSSDMLMEEHGIPDVLIGGFPCVTYSNAANIHNKKHSDAKPKSNYQNYAREGGDLFLHMRRMIGDMQPKAFVIENVTDVLGARIVMETLKNTPCSLSGKRLGRYYNFVYGNVVSSDFGVAQNRKRLIVMGFNKEIERPILWHKPLTMTHTVGKILEKNPDVPPYNGPMPPYMLRRLNQTPSPKTGKVYRQKVAIKKNCESEIANTAVAHYGGDQSTQMVLRDDGLVTPYSVREYANIQGFPSDFKIVNAKKSYRGIGNAVTVNVAKAVAEAVMLELD